MTCEKCGNKNVDWASYCTQCGKPLGWICDCSFINKQGDLYCGGCGISLTDKNSNRNNSYKHVDSFVHQFDKQQISDLIKESVYFKVGAEEKLDQSDIDNIFVNGD